MLDRLDGATKHGVEAIAVNPDGSEQSLAEARQKAGTYSLIEENFKYQVLQVPRSGVRVSTVPDTYYFFPIQAAVIDKNPSIEQNIDWGGTFDPTLK